MKFLTRHTLAAVMALGALLALVVMAPSASAYNGTAGVSVGTTTPTAGGSLAVNGVNCVPNSSVNISLDGTTALGSAPTDADGNYSTTVDLPSGVTGNHTIEVSGAQCSAVADISIQAASSGGGGGGLAGTGVAVVGIGALGVVLLIGGGLMLLAGRRRKVTA